MDYILSYLNNNEIICYIIEYSINKNINNEINKTNILNILHINKNYSLLDKYIIIGPKLNYKTPWCSNMLSILKRIGVNNLIRIEKTDIYHNSHEYKYDRSN